MVKEEINNSEYKPVNINVEMVDISNSTVDESVVDNSNSNPDSDSNIQLNISQKQLEITLSKFFKTQKELEDADKDKEIDSGECFCMGPAPTVDALNDVVDTILMVTTLLLGFTAGTYMMFGYDDILTIETRWSEWCLNSTDAKTKQQCSNH